jgi:hypothetical protein
MTDPIRLEHIQISCSSWEIRRPEMFQGAQSSADLQALARSTAGVRAIRRSSHHQIVGNAATPYLGIT